MPNTDRHEEDYYDDLANDLIDGFDTDSLDSLEDPFNEDLYPDDDRLEARSYYSI